MYKSVRGGALKALQVFRIRNESTICIFFHELRKIAESSNTQTPNENCMNEQTLSFLQPENVAHGIELHFFVALFPCFIIYRFNQNKPSGL